MKPSSSSPRRVSSRSKLPCAQPSTPPTAVGDGTPDFLRLHDAADRVAFRRWFTLLAEAEYYRRQSQRDRRLCGTAALCLSRSTASSTIPRGRRPSICLPPLPPATFGSISIRTRRSAPGCFAFATAALRPDDLNNGAFAQFADAKTLWRLQLLLCGTRHQPRAPRRSALLSSGRPRPALSRHDLSRYQPNRKRTARNRW